MKLPLLALLACTSAGAEVRTPAFPGAEGAGKWAKGGRGGKVLAVAMNYIGNYLKPGPDTSAAYRAKAFVAYAGSAAELFFEGNQVESPPAPVAFQSELIIVRADATLVMRGTPLPFEPPEDKLGAKAASTRALASAGASKPTRDAVDARILAGVRDGTGRQIKTIAADAWPALHSAEAPADTDSDGLPDAWEREHGLSPTDPADAARPATPERFTHLEIWLNSLCAEK